MSHISRELNGHAQDGSLRFSRELNRRPCKKNDQAAQHTDRAMLPRIGRTWGRFV